MVKTTAPTPTTTAGAIERVRKAAVVSPIPVVSTLTIQNIAVTSGTFTAETGAKLYFAHELESFLRGAYRVVQELRNA